MTNTITENRNEIPNNAFDLEYNTQFKKEMLYLKDHGICPVYTKKVGKYKVPTYKYTKTSELFRVCADFYKEQEANKSFNRLKKQINAISYVVNGTTEEGADSAKGNS